MSGDSRERLVKDLTLILLYLTSWEEHKYGYTYRRSWKGYDFGALDELADEDLLSGSTQAKSVYLSEKGTESARQLLKKYGIKDQ